MKDSATIPGLIDSNNDIIHAEVIWHKGERWKGQVLQIILGQICDMATFDTAVCKNLASTPVVHIKIAGIYGCSSH